MPFPVLAALGGAAIGGLASYFGQKETNSANKEMQADANSANMEMARQNREWQERMANTAHQREVADLKSAGLNPILSGTGGGGASTPSGNVATINAARAENALGQGVSSALASANLTKDLEMADSQKALNASAIDLQNTQKGVNQSTAMKNYADTDVSLMNREQKGLQNNVLETQLKVAQAQSKAELIKAAQDEKFAVYDSMQTRMKNAFETGSAAKDMVNPFKGLLGPGKNIPPSGEIFKNRKGQSGYYDKSGTFKTTD